MTAVVINWSDQSVTSPSTLATWNNLQLKEQIEAVGVTVNSWVWYSEEEPGINADTIYIGLDESFVSGTQTSIDTAISNHVPQPTPGRFSGYVVGATGGPSTSSTSFVLLPEMTLTGEFLGGDVRVDFRSNFNLTSTLLGSDGADVTIYLDGSEFDSALRGSVQMSGVAATAIQNTDIHATIAVPAGNHTIEIRWRRNGTQASVSAVGTERTLRVQETGN